MCSAIRTIWCLSVAVSISAGCGDSERHGFAPQGPQGFAVIPLTAVKYKDLGGPYFLFAEGKEFTSPLGEGEIRLVTSDEIEFEITRMYADAIARRPNSPTFRTLCGLLQRRFTRWQRLVLLESIFFGSYSTGDEDFYDFILIVVTPDGVTGATSLLWDGKFGIAPTHSASPQPLADHKEKIEKCLSELASAREVLPSNVMWAGLAMGPFLVLHDIRVSESGEPSMDHWASVIKRDFVPVARVPFWQDVDYGPARWVDEKWRNAVPIEFSEEFNRALDLYETLFARIWEAAVGPDGLDDEAVAKRPEAEAAKRFSEAMKEFQESALKELQEQP